MYVNGAIRLMLKLIHSTGVMLCKHSSFGNKALVSKILNKLSALLESREQALANTEGLAHSRCLLTHPAPPSRALTPAAATALLSLLPQPESAKSRDSMTHNEIYCDATGFTVQKEPEVTILKKRLKARLVSFLCLCIVCVKT